MAEDLRDKNGLTEEEYLQDYNPDKWKKPSVTADMCIFTETDGKYKILLIKRGNHPYIGRWALPGGFTQAGESIEETAARELEEETSVKMSAENIRLVGNYSKPGRDPRDWTISAAYMAVVDEKMIKPIAGDDAAATKWFVVNFNEDGLSFTSDELKIDGKSLAFDHEQIIRDAMKILGEG